MNTTRRTTLLALAPILVAAGAAHGQSTPMRLLYSTPGFSDPRQAINSDVLLDRIEFGDGVIVESPQFVYPAEVKQLGYSGTVGCFRTVNGLAASTGLPGCHRLEACDGNASTISVNDLKLFPAKLKQTFASNNLNNRTELKSNVQFSMTVSLATRVWDSNFELDQRPELFIFEEQGNSVLKVQACTETGSLLGTAVEIRAVDLASVLPEKVWVGRFTSAGQPSSGPYELKVATVDLTQLGVTSLKWLRITNTGSGGNGSADVKLLAVDTSPGPAAQTMTFD